MKKNIRILLYPTKTTGENRYLNNLYNTIKDSYEVTGFDEIKKKKDYFNYDIYHFNLIEWMGGGIIKQKMTYLKKKVFIYVLKLLNKKIVRTVHNNTSHDKDKQEIGINFMKFMAKKSDKIHILCTQTLQNDFLRPYKDKIVIIPHGDYIGNYPYANIKIYNRYNIPTNKKIVLFVGQVRKYKNIELLINAFKESKLEENDFVLLICWKLYNQDYGEELKNLSNENIYFDFNFIKDSEMEAYLRQSQIIAAPYNKISSLNSGPLRMAMSYKKTMMLPLIWCVKDIKNYEDFLYIYDYNKEEHYEKLLECTLKLKSDYIKNENVLKVKGEMAYNAICNQSRKTQKENRINLYKF